MTQFSTDVLVPDKQEGASGFFRVVAPVLLWVIFAGFVKSYYAANGYAPQFFLANGLLTLLTIVITILSLLLWYHKHYNKRGTLTVSDNSLDFTWDNSEREYSFNPKEVKNLTLIYDGYAGVLSPFKGYNNQISFSKDGEQYNFNFFLGSDEDAGQMATVIKKWYENGVNLKEKDSSGQERYLMLYNAAYKSVMA